MIQFPEFIEAVRALGLKIPVEVVNGNERIATDWFITGGISGGSCYSESSDDLQSWESDEPEPEFDDLNSVLSKLSPQIGQYDRTKILDTLVFREDECESHYYGNCTYTSRKVVNLWSLYNFLYERGVLPANS